VADRFSPPSQMCSGDMYRAKALLIGEEDGEAHSIRHAARVLRMPEATLRAALKAAEEDVRRKGAPDEAPEKPARAGSD
jgi:hypothetical protein